MIILLSNTGIEWWTFFIFPEYNLNFLSDHLNVILDDKFSSDICIPNFNITRQSLLFVC